MNPENQNFDKMRKTNGDIIILQMCSINDSHMMYGSRDIQRDNFLPFYRPNNPKNQNIEKVKEKKKKKHLETSSFYIHVTKIMIVCYAVPEIWRVTDVIIFHFGLFFAFLPP